MSEDHKHVASLDPHKVQQRSSRSVSKQTDAATLHLYFFTAFNIVHYTNDVKPKVIGGYL